MTKKMKIIPTLTILIGVLFLIIQLILFPGAIGSTDTPATYLLNVLGYIIFGCISFLILFKCISGKINEKLARLELFSIVVQFLTTVFLLLGFIGFSLFFFLVNYLSIILIVLGVIGFFKYKNKINFSFISEGIFILFWISGFYSSMYVVGV